MRRFRKILVVPVTPGIEPPKALKEAVDLAAASGAEVEILGHLPDPPPCEDGVAAPHREALRDEHRSVYLDRLTTWTESVDAAGLPVAITGGSQPVEVTRRVEQEGHDLVIIAGDSSIESATAARRILRTCPCPVWLLNPSFTGARVLAALDPDHGREQNRLILELARSQAELHSGELRVVHAWHLPGLDEVRSPDSRIDRDGLAILSAEVEAAHRAALDAVIDEAGMGADAVTHLVDGPAPRAINGLAELYRIDLVVLGAGAGADPSLGLGSTAEQVLAEADRSVLVVRIPRD